MEVEHLLSKERYVLKQKKVGIESDETKSNDWGGHDDDKSRILEEHHERYIDAACLGFTYEMSLEFRYRVAMAVTTFGSEYFGSNDLNVG